MPIQDKYGEFDPLVVGDTGVILNDIPTVGGGGGPAPSDIFMLATLILGEDYANDPNITIQIEPSGKFTQGCDENGNIAVTVTWTRIDGNEWGHTGSSLPNPVDFTEYGGIMNCPFRFVTNLSPVETPFTVDITLQILTGTIGDYTEDPTRDAPNEPVTESETSWDEELEQGETTIQFSYTAPADPADEPDGFVILLAEDVNGTEPPIGDFFEWGFVEYQSGQEEYTFKDWAFTPPGIPQSWWYIVVAYWDADLEKSEPTTGILVEWTDDLPDIDIVMGLDNPGTGGIDFGGAATVVALGNPAGLYTLEAGAHVDTIYDRITTEETTEVAIPRPFLKTGFIP